MSPSRRTLPRAIEDWFTKHQRALPWRVAYDPYEVWVSEVMLQQTRMEVVLRYYPRFILRFPDAPTLAAATLEDVLAHWSGLGYYRRARMLHEGAQFLLRHSGGRLPPDVSALEAVPGIGRYTAGAIASIAFGQRAPIVDGNVARILARVASITAPLASPELLREAWSLAASLVAQAEDPRRFNQGLMELGALICKPRNPDCPHCPIRKWCGAWADGTTNTLPVAPVRKEGRSLEIALLVVSDDRGRILMRREGGALMNGMFHLPHGDDSLIPGALLPVQRTRLLGSFRHVITDRRIRFDVFSATLSDLVRDGADDYSWIDPTMLDEVPHPSYVRKALAISAAAANVE